VINPDKSGWKNIGILLCSDGVWEFFDNDECAEFFLQKCLQGNRKLMNGKAGVHLDIVHGCESLCEESWSRWMEGMNLESTYVGNSTSLENDS
jgi:hypothetical protein